ncbi:MAG: HIRAN domain-containing protein [Clostridium sp.]
MNQDCKEMSIYDELKNFYINNNGHIYSYQNFDKSGLKEFNVASHKVKELKLYEKNRLADDFAEIFLNISQGRDNIDSLEGYLTLNPVINYHECILKLFIALCENEERRIFIEKLIINILTQSKCSESVKAALVLAPLVRSQNIIDILKVYSIHNEYLFYVLNAYEFMRIPNSVFFNIAKKTHGYAKFFAVLHLKPVSYDIIEWMIEEGCNNDVAVSELVYLSILSVNILDYINKTKFSKEKIEKLSKSLSIMLSDYEVSEIQDEAEVCTKLLDIIDKYTGGIYSLYIVISILYSIEADIIEYYKEKKINLQASLYNKYKNIIDKCNYICNKEKWKEVIEKETDNIEIETSVLITCVEKTGFKLKKKDFELILKRDFRNALLYKYAFTAGSKSIKLCAFDTGMNSLNINDITSGPGEFVLSKLSYDDIEHICFFIITKYMDYEDFKEDYKGFNMKAVKAQLIETRLQAVTNLEKFKGEFSDEEEKYIKEVLSLEMIPEVRRGLISLISDEKKKEKRIINVSDFTDMVPHVRDTYMKSIEISGNDRYDRSSLFNKIKENDIVYLVNDPEIAEDDSETVLVTTDKGLVIGTVPDDLGEILINLIDNGKWFYGRIESISDDYEHISIKVILSYRDILDEIGNTLMLLSNEREEYIQ